MKKSWVTIVLIGLMILTGLAGCSGGSGDGAPQGGGQSGQAPDINGDGLQAVLEQTCSYVVSNMTELEADSDGSAWIIYSLKTAEAAGAETGADESYYSDYYDNLRLFLKTHDGVLDESKYTHYERAAMAVFAMGEDSTDVEGYDLMARVDEYDKVKAQGINAEMYALISANYTGYKLANESRYKQDILDSQLADGGFAFDGDSTSVDITAMGVQALSFYEDEETRAAVDKARAYLSGEQLADGSYGNDESTAQVIIALGALKEDPTAAEDFIKDGKTLGDGLMVYWTGEAFSHVDGDADALATQQSLMALDAVLLGRQGKSLFERS